MKRLALTLVLMTATTAFAQGYDEPFVPIPLIPEQPPQENIFQKWRRERDEQWRRSEEDFARQQQNWTNFEIQQYIREQRERQEELDYERSQRRFQGR